MYTALTTPNQSSLGLIPVPSKNVCHGLLQYVLFSDENGVCMTRKTIHHFHCLFSQNENRTKLSVHLKTTSRQPVNQIGWNLTNWLPDSYSKNNCANFDFFFSFLSNSIFPQVILMICYHLLHLLSYHKRTNAHVKNLSHGFLVRRVMKRTRS